MIYRGSHAADAAVSGLAGRWGSEVRHSDPSGNSTSGGRLRC